MKLPFIHSKIMLAVFATMLGYGIMNVVVGTTQIDKIIGAILCSLGIIGLLFLKNAGNEGNQWLKENQARDMRMKKYEILKEHNLMNKLDFTEIDILIGNPVPTYFKCPKCGLISGWSTWERCPTCGKPITMTTMDDEMDRLVKNIKMSKRDQRLANKYLKEQKEKEQEKEEEKAKEVESFPINEYKERLGGKITDNLVLFGYNTVRKVANASDKELLSIDGIGHKALWRIRKFLPQTEKELLKEKEQEQEEKIDEELKKSERNT